MDLNSCVPVDSLMPGRKYRSWRLSRWVGRGSVRTGRRASPRATGGPIHPASSSLKHALTLEQSSSSSFSFSICPTTGLFYRFPASSHSRNVGEGETGSPAARGRRVLPGSDGASPYHPQASLHPQAEVSHSCNSFFIYLLSRQASCLNSERMSYSGDLPSHEGSI
jgi:hypothetical protein